MGPLVQSHFCGKQFGGSDIFDAVHLKSLPFFRLRIHSRASTNPCESYAQDVPSTDSTKRSFLDDPWADGNDPWSAARRKLRSE